MRQAAERATDIDGAGAFLGTAAPLLGLCSERIGWVAGAAFTPVAALEVEGRKQGQRGEIHGVSLTCVSQIFPNLLVFLAKLLILNWRRERDSKAVMSLIISKLLKSHKAVTAISTVLAAEFPKFSQIHGGMMMRSAFP
jgi:hypothetical protein